MSTWFWLNVPFMVLIFGAVTGIPMWLVFRRPDTGPGASTPAASTPAASTSAASTPAASTPAASTPSAISVKAAPAARALTPAHRESAARELADVRG